MSAQPAPWFDDNLRYLSARVQRVLSLAQATGARGVYAPHSGRTPDEEILSRMDREPMLLLLQRLFGLTDFEIDVLLTTVAWVLDRGAAIEVPALSKGPSFAATLRALPGAHWSACMPNRPLRRCALISLEGAEDPVSAPLSIEESVLHFLKGAPSVDVRTGAATRPLHTTALPRLRDMDAAQDLLASYQSGELVQIVGSRRRGWALARSVADAIRAEPRAIRVEDMSPRSQERAGLVRVLARDAVLQSAVLVADATLGETQQRAISVAEEIAELGAPVLVLCRDFTATSIETSSSLRLAQPTYREIVDGWAHAFNPKSDAEWAALRVNAAHFDLEPSQIDEVHRRVSESPEGAPLEDRLRDACIELVTGNMDGLADRVECPRSLDDLLVPGETGELIEAIAAHARERHRVDHEWGFGSTAARTEGVSVLFSGPSGTGKTMAAEGIARRVGLPLYRIDLARIVSKYIGETEKQLSRVFDVADRGGSVLLFDEADALFGKRSSVSSSHDRHANIEVSYLLQRLEAFTGLAVLTTNHVENIDPAFLRRMRFQVDFPAPGPRLRAEIWRRVFPAEAPLGALDYEELAEAQLTGGGIRNAAVVAAALALESGDRIEVRHVRRAIALELRKHHRSNSGFELWARNQAAPLPGELR